MDDQNRLVSSDVEVALNEEDQGLSFIRRNLAIRYVVTFMGFLSYTILSMNRVNMSVALVCMVDWNNLVEKSGSQSCRRYLYESNYTLRSRSEDGPYIIETDIQGHILAGYSYGLLLTQYIGVILSEKWSAKYLILLGSLFSSIITALIPQTVGSKGHYIILMQILKGASQGIVMPAFSVLITKWLPKNEIFYAMCIVGCGIPFGGFLGIYASAIICATDEWSYIFYIFAGIGLVFCLLWIATVFDSPKTHPYITYHEMVRIIRSHVITPKTSPSEEPYKHVLKSFAVWAYLIVGFVAFWAISIYTTLIPIFMSTVLKLGIKMTGLFSSLPFILEMVAFLFACVLNDKLKKVGRISYTKIHKIQIIVGLFGFIALILALPFTGCHRNLTVACVIMALGFGGIILASTSYIPMELSPRNSEIISGIMNAFGAVTGIIVPTMMGYLVGDKRTMNAWSILFGLTAGLGGFGLIVFLYFGSGSVQNWIDPSFRGIQEVGEGEEPAGEVDSEPEQKKP